LTLMLGCMMALQEQPFQRRYQDIKYLNYSLLLYLELNGVSKFTWLVW
jgi:hypothetical protein